MQIPPLQVASTNGPPLSKPSTCKSNADRRGKGAQPCAAQDPTMYKDVKTGIELGVWGYTPDVSDEDDPGFGAYQFGMALPEDALTKDATEYIGVLVSVEKGG